MFSRLRWKVFILDMPQFEPQYMLVVDRKNNLDSLQVQVEVRKDFFSDDMGSMLAMKKSIERQTEKVSFPSVPK